GNLPALPPHDFATTFPWVRLRSRIHAKAPFARPVQPAPRLRLLFSHEFRCFNVINDSFFPFRQTDLAERSRAGEKPVGGLSRKPHRAPERKSLFARDGRHALPRFFQRPIPGPRSGPRTA